MQEFNKKFEENSSTMLNEVTEIQYRRQVERYEDRYNNFYKFFDKLVG